MFLLLEDRKDKERAQRKLETAVKKMYPKQRELNLGWMGNNRRSDVQTNGHMWYRHELFRKGKVDRWLNWFGYLSTANGAHITVEVNVPTDDNSQTVSGFGRENQKHLTDLAIINLGVLWKKFGALIENLRTMNYVGNSLSREYRYETYTAHLSRFDLTCIAYRLPPRHGWNTHEFDEARRDIRQRFDLSSNEFARAVNLIKENLEMAAIIEAPRPLHYTSVGQLRTFFDSWCDLHCRSNTNNRVVSKRHSGHRRIPHDCAPLAIY